MFNYSTQLTKAKVFLENAKENYSKFFESKDEAYLSSCGFNLCYASGFYVNNILNLIDQRNWFSGEDPSIAIDKIMDSDLDKQILNELNNQLMKLKDILKSKSGIVMEFSMIDTIII